MRAHSNRRDAIVLPFEKSKLRPSGIDLVVSPEGQHLFAKPVSDFSIVLIRAKTCDAAWRWCAPSRCVVDVFPFDRSISFNWWMIQRAYHSRSPFTLNVSARGALWAVANFRTAWLHDSMRGLLTQRTRSEAKRVKFWANNCILTLVLNVGFCAVGLRIYVFMTVGIFPHGPRISTTSAKHTLTVVIASYLPFRAGEKSVVLERLS